jgi:uncharacterized protein (TIGR00369 family)
MIIPNVPNVRDCQAKNSNDVQQEMEQNTMRHEAREVPVQDAQKISDMCFVCGVNNPASLHTQFLELEDGRLCAEFIATDMHQSYPGRAHGGIISAVLDETIGRAIQIAHPEVFGVTFELNVRFRKPVPLNVPLRIIAEITEYAHRLFSGEGKLLLPDGSVAAEAKARYLQMAIGNITEGGLNDQDWCPDEREFPETVIV